MAGPMVIQTGGIRAGNLQSVLEQDRINAQETQAQPLVSGLAGHVRRCWSDARMAKQQVIEPRMLQNMRARRGEYDPDKMAKIKEMGGSDAYAGITSVKCRAAASWLRDIMLTTGQTRPWGIKPGPMPELPPELGDMIVAKTAEQIREAEMQGNPMNMSDTMDLVESIRDQTREKLIQEARVRTDRMSDKMEQQLLDGNFLNALDAFIDDITTFPSAVLKGPIVRKKKTLTWKQEANNYTPVVQDQLVLEWERVSPFDIYPSPASDTVDNGYLIQKHTLSRQDLLDLVDVDGYDKSSIYAVLDDYGRGGLREWLTNDVAIASAEGNVTTLIRVNADELIDAIQFWGSVQGRDLLDWGMDEKEIPDPMMEYHVEVWVIGHYVIKAVMNYDPLHRKPYYKASYETVPGNWWGNSVADLVRHPQIVSNAVARAIVNNVGIASGPQVAVNIDRLAPGEDITQLTPWRIWQMTNDPSGNGQGMLPIQFYQPDSRIGELMQVFEMFSGMADEYSGLPKYMAGDSAGGAGRTASGLSMLMGNAGKAIKQVVANMDINLMEPVLTRLYEHNMLYATDPDLKGTVNIIARGAQALMAQDAAQLRRTQFLQSTTNPIDMQIIGVEGRAAVLREVAQALEMDTDLVVPPLEVIKAKMAAAEAARQPPQPPGQGGPPGAPPVGAPPPAPGSAPPGMPQLETHQSLPTGGVATANFAPNTAPG